MSTHVRGLAALVMPPVELMPGAVPAAQPFKPVARTRKPGDTVSDMVADADTAMVERAEPSDAPVLVAQLDVAPPAAGAAAAPAAAAEDCTALGADGCGETVGADADPVVGIWALLPLLALGGGGGGSDALQVFKPTTDLELAGGGRYALPIDQKKNDAVGDFDASKSNAQFRITRVLKNNVLVEDQELFDIDPDTGTITLSQNAKDLQACIGAEFKIYAQAFIGDREVTGEKLLTLVLDAPSEQETFKLGVVDAPDFLVGNGSELDMLTLNLDSKAFPALFGAWENLGLGGWQLYLDWDQGSVHARNFDYIQFDGGSGLPANYAGYELDAVYKIGARAADGVVQGSDCADFLVGLFDSTDPITLNGGKGDDVLIGSALASNTLAGGAGNDLLIGGEKADTYQFDLTTLDHGVDWLVSFKVGDTISLELGAVDFTFNFTLDDRAELFAEGRVTSGDLSIEVDNNSAFFEFWYDGTLFAVMPLPPVTYDASAPFAA